MDLFEHYDMIPKDVSHIIDNWEEYETYEGLERLLIGDALIQIMQGFSSTITNPMALQGKTIGEFNKRYNGRAEIGTVKDILSKLIEV